jgi:hypothetical protein
MPVAATRPLGWAKARNFVTHRELSRLHESIDRNPR